MSRKKYTRRSPLSRFWAKVEKTETCWLWTGCLSDEGYALFRAEGKTYKAHRWIWEQEKGPIPDGLVLDHVLTWGCTNHNCVRLEHLEPVTVAENNQRKARAITHCPQGHAYAGENLYIYPDGGRDCRICNRNAVRRYRVRKALKRNLDQNLTRPAKIAIIL